MPDKKTAYSLTQARLREAENERFTSGFARSEWERAYNKGMIKAYRTLCEDLEQHGLADSPVSIHKEESL